jgi:acetate kinase
MATRAGSLDPGISLWLEQHAGLSAPEVEEALEQHSGLAGLAGDADMRAVLERAGAGDADAQLAIDVYLHRLRAGIAAMAAAMDGVDVLVFTGGVGERAATVRARAVAGISFLGVALDLEANADPVLDAEVGASRAQARAFVVAAREDLQIARDVRRALA